MKPKNQRLVLVSAALAAVLVAVLLAMWGLGGGGGEVLKTAGVGK